MKSKKHIEKKQWNTIQIEEVMLKFLKKLMKRIEYFETKIKKENTISTEELVDEIHFDEVEILLEVEWMSI
jgi:hypothetical protein